MGSCDRGCPGVRGPTWEEASPPRGAGLGLWGSTWPEGGCLGAPGHRDPVGPCVLSPKPRLPCPLLPGSQVAGGSSSQRLARWRWPLRSDRTGNESPAISHCVFITQQPHWRSRLKTLEILMWISGENRLKHSPVQAALLKE